MLWSYAYNVSVYILFLIFNFSALVVKWGSHISQLVRLSMNQITDYHN